MIKKLILVTSLAISSLVHSEEDVLLISVKEAVLFTCGAMDASYKIGYKQAQSDISKGIYSLEQFQQFNQENNAIFDVIKYLTPQEMKIRECYIETMSVMLKMHDKTYTLGGEK